MKLKKNMDTRNDIIRDFNNTMRQQWSDGVVHDEDGFYQEFHDYCDNAVIYTYQAKLYCELLDYDIFAEHDIWGKADNWSQAGYAALYDFLMEHDDVLTFDELEKEFNPNGY